MKKKIIKSKSLDIDKPVDGLFNSVASLINQCQLRVAAAVNEELVHLYWNVGKLIRHNILQNKRAGYSEQVIQLLSEKLIEEYGSGWGEKQLRHCLRIAETFSEEEILYALRRQLSWTHLRTLCYLHNKLQQEFYLEMCAHERWSTRQLQERIDSMLFKFVRWLR